MTSSNYPSFVSRPIASLPESLARSPIGSQDQLFGSISGLTGQDGSSSGQATNMNRINNVLLSPTNHDHLPSPLAPSRPSDPAHPVSGLHHIHDRDPFLPHLSSQSNQVYNQSISVPNSSISNPSSSRTTIWWGDLEPWMDEEYARQVCSMMNWDPISVKVPRPAPDHISGQHPNNPGYCFLTFSSQNQAASVLNQMNGSNVTMPNSNKPFVLNWASVVPASPPASTFTLPPSLPIPQAQPQSQPQFSKEYSIFVGDLAPEVSNSDLVAVFRNPVLGLRNDREPRFIRPFLSCKSAKIMLDPVTGVSRGYGFVRFTDESDQQRALIEMHGLYCLSRPMRISPATAKYKGQSMSAGEPGMPSFTVPSPEQQQALASSIPDASAQSVSGPLASHSAGSNASLHSGSGSASSIPSLSSGQSSSSSTLASVSEDPLKSQSGQGETNSGGGKSSVTFVNSITSSFAGQQVQDPLSSETYIISEESWKHHAQARAILSNLIGPNGEQLSSSDPYNTTVFVGGLSPLISEDTLRTFFEPFGDIHYVKVPAGKNCGFVQFIRKPDAERAIEKMQGFPIGGSRIRLSWGRSQYKAAQAAAQAAQTAALQTQFPQPSPLAARQLHNHHQPQQISQPTLPQSSSQSPTPQAMSAAITPDQALELVHKLGLVNYFANPEPPSHVGSSLSHGFASSSGTHGMNFREDEALSSPLNVFHGSYRPSSGQSTIDAQIMRPQVSSFSPFSPDPNVYGDETKISRDSFRGSRIDNLNHPLKSYAAGFGDIQGMSLSGKVSPASTTPSHNARQSSGPNTPRYGPFYDSSSHIIARSSSRGEAGSMMHHTSPPRKLSPGRETEFDGQESIHDLNGTLASLDLDNGQGSWRHMMSSSSPPS